MSREPVSHHLLGADGPLARELPGFQPRDVQQQLALAVEQTLDEFGTLVAEAGTGTGKTFAYLVPVLLSGRKVIISTGTKALQDQLFHRDLPKVRQVLNVRLKTALLKGRSNYLCLYRLDGYSKQGELVSRNQVSQLQQIRSWAGRTGSGDIMELNAVPEDSPLWPAVTSTVDNCLGSECPMFQDCHVVRARRQAQEADVVVVNHHLLFADLGLKAEGFGEILPGAQAFVIDEAHQLPELAGQFFSINLSARQLDELAGDCLREAGQVPAALAQLQEPARAVELAIRRLRMAMQGQPERGRWQPLLEHKDVNEAVQALDQTLAELLVPLQPLAESSRGLAGCLERVERLRSHLSLFIEAKDGERVFWYELSSRGFAVHATPLSVAEPLSEYRATLKAAWIYTSATLAVAGDFSHFADQLGLENPHSVCLDSPFDYASNALAYFPQGLPEPASRYFTERVVQAALPVLRASRGRAFMLFTSHRALREAATLLAEQCEFPLFVQGTRPRPALLEAFRNSGNGVLLGAASFWEGVDVAGDALSCVIIDKLPFASPGDPVLEARLASLREDGGNPFMQLQVPNAVIALKQGVGRLIRTINDRGVLVLCDPRLISKPYGRVFLGSLPAIPRTRRIEAVEAFFEAT